MAPHHARHMMTLKKPVKKGLVRRLKMQLDSGSSQLIRQLIDLQGTAPVSSDDTELILSLIQMTVHPQESTNNLNWVW